MHTDTNPEPGALYNPEGDSEMVAHDISNLHQGHVDIHHKFDVWELAAAIVVVATIIHWIVT